MPIVLDTDRVFSFVRSQMPLQRVEGMQAIGLERGGELVAGVVYEGYSGPNIWIHCAAVPGARWLNRDFLGVAFRYPFVQLHVERVTAYVEASNSACRRFVEHLGFGEEAVLTGAARDGADVLIYVMWRRTCRFLGDLR